MEELIKKIMKECEADGEPVTYEEAKEMAEMEKGASELVRVQDAHADTKKEKTPRKVKISDEKQQIFTDISNFLAEKYETTVLTDNKMLEISLNGKKFKLNLSENRQKKA